MIQVPTNSKARKPFFLIYGLLFVVVAILMGFFVSNNTPQELPVVTSADIPLPYMIAIPAGSFRMGGRMPNELPQRTIELESFLLSHSEVTFAQWDAYADAADAYRPYEEGWGRGDQPVINVSWNDIQAYIDWLNKQTGETYRLPTEAEWEYAARAGSTTEYFWGDDIGSDNANCSDCGSERDNRGPGPVASFAANAWGLHDMHGNVWEWVQDCHLDDYSDSPRDGSAYEREDCSSRVLRGGSWYNLPLFLRSAFRLSYSPTDRNSDVGFRLARDL